MNSNMSELIPNQRDKEVAEDLANLFLRHSQGTTQRHEIIIQIASYRAEIEAAQAQRIATLTEEINEMQRAGEAVEVRNATLTDALNTIANICCGEDQCKQEARTAIAKAKAL